MTKKAFLRLKTLFIRREEKPPDLSIIFAMSPAIEPMDQEPLSELEIKAWLQVFEDSHALEHGRSHLERCYQTTLYLIENPPYDDPLY